jgi:hypothetical protein
MRSTSSSSAADLPGMEAARPQLSAHRATLLSRRPTVGGTAWFSQLTTPANGPLIDWQVAELRTPAVDVRPVCLATADAASLPCDPMW